MNCSLQNPNRRSRGPGPVLEDNHRKLSRKAVEQSPAIDAGVEIS